MIRKKVEALIAAHGSRNPFVLCEKLGIHIEFRPYSDKTKGFLLKVKDTFVIVINSNMPNAHRCIILAHELGHAVLHAKKVAFMSEVEFFPTSSKMELEANKFAAELLICDGDKRDMPVHAIKAVDKRIVRDLIFYKCVKFNSAFVELKKLYSEIKEGGS